MRTLACVAALTLAAGAVLAAGDEALLPPSGAVPGFARIGSARVFPGADLYAHIDGGAEIFFEFGFERLTVQDYRGPAGELGVECYRMSDPLAALGIYLGRCGRETPAPGLGERHTAGRYQLLLVRDRFFVVIDNPAGTPALEEVLVEFAHSLASRLPPPRPLDAFAPLPAEGLLPGTQRLIRGPVALEAIATLGRGDILQLGGTLTAVAGEYAGEDGRTALIVVTYPGADAARAALAHLEAGLDPEIVPVRSEEERLVFRDYDGSFGAATVVGPRLEIRLRLKRPPA